MAMTDLGFRALKHSRFLFDIFLSQSTVKVDSMNERAVKFLTSCLLMTLNQELKC